MVGMSLNKLAGIVRTSIERNTKYIEPRIMIISMIAAICFPLYYIIWYYVFPQPYENLWLRAFGSALFIPSIFVKYWPNWTKQYKSIYWYLATLYTLPFFFFFMLLKNNGSDVWWSSTMVATFLMLIWLDWLNVVIQSALGMLLAGWAYYLTTETPNVNIFTLEQVPIYLFAIVVGVATNYSAEMLRQERIRAMLATASNIAHELRTPLLGIKSGAAGLRQHLPALLDGYRLARSQGLAVDPIRLVHLKSIHGVLERIESEADHSNIIIDMLLMNIRINNTLTDNYSVCSIRKCVEMALGRFPFSSEKERRLVKWEQGMDFSFRGHELLTVHVMFNLIKNALYHIAKAGKGEVVIRLSKAPQGNMLIFRDTGAGVPPEILPHIFTRFYSWSSDAVNGPGAGIGLAFCRNVMNSFGGSISCKSRSKEYTEFILIFPSAELP